MGKPTVRISRTALKFTSGRASDLRVKCDMAHEDLSQPNKEHEPPSPSAEAMSQLRTKEEPEIKSSEGGCKNRKSSVRFGENVEKT